MKHVFLMKPLMYFIETDAVKNNGNFNNNYMSLI